MLHYNTNFQYHSNENIVIIWQAKAACTLVNHMFYHHEKLLETALEYSSWIHDYRQMIRKIKGVDTDIFLEFKVVNPSTKYIQFTVNPYKRAVSSYMHALTHRYIGKENTNISFHEFIDKLLVNLIKENVHHNLQTFLFKKKGKINKIDYIHMEKINENIHYLKDKYNLRYVIPSENQCHKRFSSKDKKTNCSFIGNINWESIKNINPIHYNVFYNDEIKNKVYTLYKEDFYNLGYTWEMFINTKY